MVRLFGFSIFVVSFSAFANECYGEKTEIDMSECTTERYKSLDKELNVVYRAKMLELDSIKIHSDGANVKPVSYYLKMSQLAWIKMRDADCDLETYESMGGTGYDSIYHNCLADKTRDRINKIKAMMY